MRLNKFLAHSGVGTRRQADELIRKGKVTINGETVVNPAYMLNSEEEVHYNGKKLYIQKGKVYLLMNKPKKFSCTYDLEEHFSIARLLKNKLQNVVTAPLSLDNEERGLILLTDDEPILEKFNEEGHRIKQIFQLTLDKDVDSTELDMLNASKDIINVSHVKNEAPNVIGVEFHETNLKLLYQAIEQTGKKIEILDRTYIAGLTKKDLPRGFHRNLTEKEVIFLRHFF